jgi:hypothetical protein
MVERLHASLREKEAMPQHRELMELIESDKHVLIGAKALAFYTEPRFTQDTDYIVSGRTFQRIRKWMRENNVAGADLGLVLRFHSLAVDVLDGRGNSVLKEILRREPAKPSAEALAASKYVSLVSQQRGPRRMQDVAVFAQLVTLDRFDLDTLKDYLVEEYAAQWPEILQLIEDIRAGRPITI